jgi:hypothetical protein
MEILEMGPNYHQGKDAEVMQVMRRARRHSVFRIEFFAENAKNELS